jgi:hypothetical protein
MRIVWKRDGPFFDDPSGIGHLCGYGTPAGISLSYAAAARCMPPPCHRRCDEEVALAEEEDEDGRRCRGVGGT